MEKETEELKHEVDGQEQYSKRNCILFHGILHCVKSVFIWSYSGPPFPAFGLNMERYSVPIRLQSECGEMQTILTPTQTIFTQCPNHQMKTPAV